MFCECGNSSIGRARAFQACGCGFESRFPLIGSTVPQLGRSLEMRGRKSLGQGVAHVAQSVEHILGKDEVTGSIPVVGSMRNTPEI